MCRLSILMYNTRAGTFRSHCLSVKVSVLCMYTMYDVLRSGNRVSLKRLERVTPGIIQAVYRMSIIKARFYYNI